MYWSSSIYCFSFQSITEKHRMSFPETVDEILDVSEDEGKIQLQDFETGMQCFFKLTGKKTRKSHFRVSLNCAPFAFPRSCTANARYECLPSLCSVYNEHKTFPPSQHTDITDLLSLTFSVKWHGDGCIIGMSPSSLMSVPVALIYH